MPTRRIAHTLPLLLRGPHDLPITNACLASLAAAEPGARLVVCNQGYEDDSLLLGHRLRLGLARDWRPQCWLGARVFHATLAQRMTVGDLAQAVVANLNGLLAQYGVVGLEQLAALYPASVEFRQLADRIVADLAAADPSTR